MLILLLIGQVAANCQFDNSTTCCAQFGCQWCAGTDSCLDIAINCPSAVCQYSCNDVQMPCTDFPGCIQCSADCWNCVPGRCMSIYNNCSGVSAHTGKILVLVALAAAALGLIATPVSAYRIIKKELLFIGPWQILIWVLMSAIHLWMSIGYLLTVPDNFSSTAIVLLISTACLHCISIIVAATKLGTIVNFVNPVVIILTFLISIFGMSDYASAFALFWIMLILIVIVLAGITSIICAGSYDMVVFVVA